MENQESNQSNPVNNPQLPQIQQLSSEKQLFKKPNRWLIPLLLLVIVLLLGSTSFFAYHFFQPTREFRETSQIVENDNSQKNTERPQPTMNPTANWQIYSDTSYGFSFQYPNDWEVRDMLPNNINTPSHSDKLVFLGLAPVSIKEDTVGSISITTQNIDQIIEDLKTITPGSPSRVVSEKEITFLGIEAIEIIRENTLAQVRSKAIIFAREGNTYILNGGGTEDNSVIEAIINSFSFDTPRTTELPEIIDRVRPVTNSDWQTFSDSRGFTFQYPTNWYVAPHDTLIARQVQNWDPRIELQGPLQGKQSKWDINISTNSYINIEDVFEYLFDLIQVNQIEKSATSDGDIVYFAQGTSSFFGNESIRVPIIYAVITHEDDYVGWYGFYSEDAEAETLKRIVESIKQ